MNIQRERKQTGFVGRVTEDKYSSRVTGMELRDYGSHLTK